MSQEKAKKIVLNIGGMTCVNCARAIEKRLSKLNGIINATVILAAEKAIIEYDPAVVDQRAIEDAITEVGYQVIHERITLQIGGMSCVSCAKTIENTLGYYEGVYKASLNFATEKLSVEYNPQQISVASIKKIIKDVGYQVIEP
jgi:Cu+-exporting ATPase